MHYYECWIDRNMKYHEEEFQCNRIIKWYQKVKESMINSPYPQVKAFVQRNQLDTECVKIQAMQRWIYNVNEMVKKAEEKPKNDIRRYFEEL